MNVLIVGVGQGSWQIRGVQIGAALGARATTRPHDNDWRWADVCILVKRAVNPFAQEAHAFRVPIIWDALDFWQQPSDNTLTREAATSLTVTDCRERLMPALVIGATQAMADDLGGVCLPHHSRPGLSSGPVRQTMQVVAYEGTPKYLGSWRKALETVCARIGLTFVVNPPDLRQADVVVAFRGERWDGPICRRWKSGVKCVNALAAGRPLITQPSAAFTELQTPGTVIDQVSELYDAIGAYAPLAVRQAVVEACASRVSAFTVEAVAGRYRAVIADVMRLAA